MYPLNPQRHCDLGAWCGPNRQNTGLYMGLNVDRPASGCFLPKQTMTFYGGSLFSLSLQAITTAQDFHP